MLCSKKRRVTTKNIAPTQRFLNHRFECLSPRKILTADPRIHLISQQTHFFQRSFWVLVLWFSPVQQFFSWSTTTSKCFHFPIKLMVRVTNSHSRLDNSSSYMIPTIFGCADHYKSTVFTLIQLHAKYIGSNDDSSSNYATCLILIPASPVQYSVLLCWWTVLGISELPDSAGT